jgi:hypothetical protein
MRTKKTKRGAAMIEAIVVMGTLLVFFGMTKWAFRAYGGKIDQAASTRRDALYYASHSCDKENGDDPDTYADPALRQRSVTSGISSFSLVGLIRAIRRQNANIDVTATARAVKGPTLIEGVAATHVGYRRVENTTLAARLRTASAVGCNERRLGNGLLALLRFQWEFVKSLVTG